MFLRIEYLYIFVIIIYNKSSPSTMFWISIVEEFDPIKRPFLFQIIPEDTKLDPEFTVPIPPILSINFSIDNSDLDEISLLLIIWNFNNKNFKKNIILIFLKSK